MLNSSIKEDTKALTDDGVVSNNKLDVGDFDQARALQAECAAFDGFRVKFNWEMMADRPPGVLNDFCFYDGGRLVAYAPLDGFGALYEITAAVLPAYRGRGIFRQLLAAARAEAERRRARQVLLVAYRASSDAPARTTRCGAPYVVSEYHMEATLTIRPHEAQTDFAIVDVDATNVADLSRLTEITFGIDHARTAAQLLDEIKDPSKKYYLAVRNGAAIGQIGVVLAEKEVYIRGFGIVPEHRGRGYGRQLLAAVVARGYGEADGHFSLDVETENAGALSLYKSCGFEETLIYDYYRVA